MLQKFNIHADSHPEVPVLVIRGRTIATEETTRIQLTAVLITTVLLNFIHASLEELFVGI